MNCQFCHCFFGLSAGRRSRQQHCVRCTINDQQHTATHCNTLQHTATHCNTLQHTAAHCSTLQHTTIHCNPLQHTVTHCSILQHSAVHGQWSTTHRNTMPNTATYCSTLQQSVAIDQLLKTYYNTLWHTATRCNTLQHSTAHDQWPSQTRCPPRREKLREGGQETRHAHKHTQTRTHKHTHTHTHTHTYTLSCDVAAALHTWLRCSVLQCVAPHGIPTHTLSLTFPLSLSYTHIYTHTHVLSLPLSLLHIQVGSHTWKPHTTARQLFVQVDEGERVRVCVWERERERVWVCRVLVQVDETERVCVRMCTSVCVCEREKERGKRRVCMGMPYATVGATHYNTLQHTATRRNTRQHTATPCNTLQHTAPHCNTGGWGYNNHEESAPPKSHGSAEQLQPDVAVGGGMIGVYGVATVSRID